MLIWKQYLRISPLYAQFVHLCLFCLYWIFWLDKTVTLTLFIRWDIRRCHTHEPFGFLAWNAILRELLIFPGLLYQEGTFYAVVHIFMLLNHWTAHTFVNYILQYQLNTCTSLWLGPHLFSIFINDLMVNIECNIKLFCRQHFSLHNF